ncbi:unnamed protein product [Paramecium octaurelia]|uniref:Uncharacterized protein n=1 Tax=Paramecium octaurelia TaxID=43137 RepID=A0A8S1Y580_PAROT|nr:unnamed protein product [Paramecium octaurelia]
MSKFKIKGYLDVKSDQTLLLVMNEIIGKSPLIVERAKILQSSSKSKHRLYIQLKNYKQKLNLNRNRANLSEVRSVTQFRKENSKLKLIIKKLFKGFK